MKKTISVVALASILTAGTAFASGYRIPEQSADSTAKAGANVAGALGADAAYFNPANMSWMKNDGWLAEGNASYIHLTPIEYDDNRTSMFDDESKDENFLIPTFFLVSPDYNGMHFGLSFVVPYGLAKRWDGFGGLVSNKFALKTFELNPTLSYRFCDYFSFAAGARVLYGKLTQMSNGSPASGITISRYFDGDTIEYGWNAALSFKPNDASNLSLTYRSYIEAEFEGDALLSTSPAIYPGSNVDTSSDLTGPAPAVLALSGAYDFGKWKVEFTIDRTFWSEYEELDFEYDTPIVNPILFSAFDAPADRSWDDVNAYRIGVDYRMSEDFTLMFGFAYDENPVPDETIDFSLPDSDAYIVSVGGRYKLNEKSEVAFGLLYDYKESRDANTGAVNGEFSGASAIFATVGFSYKF